MRIRYPREFPLLLLTLAIAAGLALRVPAFRTFGNLTALGESGASIGLLACGEGIVLLGGALDLSVGSLLGLTGCATGAALAAGMAWPIAALLGLLAALVAGLCNGLLVAWRGIPSILATLATMLIFLHGASLVTNDTAYSSFPRGFNLIGSGAAPFLILVIVTVVLALLVTRFRWGRRLLAMGGAEEAARLAGISVSRLRVESYMLSGFCAGIAGLVVMAFNNASQAGLGKGMELDAIAACVVGGARLSGGDGSLPGIVLGALLMALLRDGFVLTGRPESQYGIITGAVILLAAALEQLRSRKARRGEMAHA